MNQAQKKYAIERLTAITAERVTTLVQDYDKDDAAARKLKFITVQDFIDNPPPQLGTGNTKLTFNATLDSVFDMRALNQMALTRYDNAMSKYDTTFTPQERTFISVINPVTCKVVKGISTYTRVKKLVDRKLAKLVTAVDSLMLGDAGQMQDIIDNF